ncbi:MAG: hypothetical protein GY809_04425 [Planctomycetes bacterium]|nr:hypothetical protein [Planctomycetota bacterium]
MESKTRRTVACNSDSPCRLARRRLFGQVASGRNRIRPWFPKAGIAVESAWIQRHISVCPRCQRRFSGLGKVSMGLNLIKSQSHGLDLLKRANTAAIGVLKHGLRESDRASQLRTGLPMPSLGQKIRGASQGLFQTAACIAILILSKMSVFSSIDRVQKQGRTTVRHFYDCQLGTDLSQDLFSDV